jgi:hypothetical protein
MSYFTEQMDKMNKKFKNKEFILYIEYNNVLDNDSIKKNIVMLDFDKLPIMKIDGTLCAKELRGLNITILPALIHIDKNNNQKQYALADFNTLK